MTKAETPPEHLWADSEGLETWWKQVEQKRNEQYGLDSGNSSDDDSDGEWGDRDQGSGMAENELARSLKNG